MADRQEPIMVFPRYTTVLGGGLPFFTAPIPCVNYSRVNLAFWHGTLLNSPSVGVIFMESTDGVDFTQCGGGPWSVPGGAGEVQVSAVLTK